MKAMTKKERAEMDAAIERAELLAALRWTAEVAPDLEIPDYPGHTQGWDFNAHTLRVEPAWSGSVVHGYGVREVGQRYRSASQGGRRLYSTAARAWAAMRATVEKESAQKLLRIDRALRNAQGNDR